ncbi:Transcription-repair-coupling factor [Planctomycetes bacterium LzC2]|uniref:Transcription-repair-coupling factor n=1 Tax=Alienimonas chondri TaxID=2681879 RepID=A0ABX1VCA8_9PLAN|nr:Transcription-repair-coupling factor [Alienimonas chondri]
MLADLPGLLLRDPQLSTVAAALARGDGAALEGAWAGSAAAAIAALVQGEEVGGVGRPLLVVTARVAGTDHFAADVAAMLGEQSSTNEGIGRSVALFPARDGLTATPDPADPVFAARAGALNRLEDEDAASRPRVLVAPIQALMQPVPSRSARAAATRTLTVGDEADPEELMRWLADRGLERVPRIAMPGEFSLHGGIFDVWPAGETDPLRVEFAFDEIDSLRTFDPVSQRKRDGLNRARLTCLPAAPIDGEAPGADGAAIETASLFDSLPENYAVALLDLAEITDEGRHYLNRLDDPRGLYTVRTVLARCTQRPSVTLARIGASSYETTGRLRVEAVEKFTGPKGQAIEQLDLVLGEGERALVACHNKGELKRLGELIEEVEAENGPALKDRVTLCVGELSAGFRLVDHGLLVLTDHELFGRAGVRGTSGPRRPAESRAIDNFLDLSDGDLIVHLTNGIGRFRGLKALEQRGQKEEHLELEFAGDVRVFVPASLIHLVQKYVGATKAAPKLSKLGTLGWSKKKKQAADAVEDMAADMLRMQAARQSEPGLSHAEPTDYVEEFAAAFPYEPTPDQASAFAEIQTDLSLPRPMDRLICGDVGYGKTEVAMRAAFRAVDGGRQVAVLVPTTVLCEQHARSFAERMAEFPISVESLSRFRTRREQKRVLKGLKEGTVDIVIGTHRLVSPDIKFADLGLLVIDEEQRFGVDVKEALKQIRLQVDVLTLSATPIPRTLHMSLLGLRDISNLTTPPPGRQPIETRVTRWDDTLIRHALVRELNRGGQVYFVHNRVQDIEQVRDRVLKIVPEATAGIVHGQMPPSQVEETMAEFVRGNLDILLATTIIESGLDVPNANTMFIHEADRYGLADLHQLRGRVGRHHNRAYCYLLLKDGRMLTDVAAKRLKAIEEYSELGAGFKIAMRDLEIRGAGNILGTEQSGQINAVGYELYCQLLENAVHQLKGEPIRKPLAVNVDLPVSAFLPDGYVPPGRTKLEVYRKLSNVRSTPDLAEFAEELKDRFGPPPAPVGRLLAVKRFQLACRDWSFTDAKIEDGYARFNYEDADKMTELKGWLKKNLRVADRRTAYIPLPDPTATDEALLEDLMRFIG